MKLIALMCLIFFALGVVTGRYIHARMLPLCSDTILMPNEKLACYLIGEP